MAFTFPEFPEPVAIDAQRSWTAKFVSYDQRNDDAYYAVTLHEAGHDTAPFMVVIGVEWAGDNWTGPEFVPHVRADIQRIAATGKTNTTYTGPMFHHLPRS